MSERTEGGGQLKLLVVIDKFPARWRECLAIDLACSFKAKDVIGLLQYLFAVRGAPGADPPVGATPLSTAQHPITPSPIL